MGGEAWKGRSVAEIPHDLASAVDAEGRGELFPGEIDRGEAAAAIKEAMSPSTDTETGYAERSHDLAAVIDRGRISELSPGEIERGEAAAL